MAQPNQVTPTVQANLAGTSTTVNLRDWLNTRLSPFLKKAIIESLDSEAEYPLQWLGEHLIQQSILFEGNPDTTNIRERFVYKHEPRPNTDQAQNSVPAPTPTVDQEQQQPQQQQQQQPATDDQGPPVAMSGLAPVPASQSEPITLVSETAPAIDTSISEAEQGQGLPSTAQVNGTPQPGTDARVQDTEMSNAS